MNQSTQNLGKNLGLKVLGAFGAVGLIFTVVKFGDIFKIGLLQSQGGILVTLIILGELVFFSLLLFGVLKEKL